MDTSEDNSKGAFYDELNALISKIPSQQVVVVGIDANAKMGLEQQSDVLGKWYYPAERTSDNGDRLPTCANRRASSSLPSFYVHESSTPSAHVALLTMKSSASGR
ncbi:hypothetical protein RB195_024171 [Necator americanus]|uniref:Uncharacterized protein n=1 Tax=Necator americanus TaxID=51031 RepID=A0ABR1EM50_NECAM